MIIHNDTFFILISFEMIVNLTVNYKRLEIKLVLSRKKNTFVVYI